MSSYISFLERLVKLYPIVGIKQRWEALIKEKDRSKAAKEIKDFIIKNGRIGYTHKRKVFDKDLNDFVEIPAKTWYYFPFVQSKVLNTERLMIIYDFFFIPRNLKLTGTFEFDGKNREIDPIILIGNHAI